MDGQRMPGQMTMPQMPTKSAPNDGSAAARAFADANNRMMRGMNVPLTADADRNFVTGMIPHHQGAIDMAKAELAYGKDAELRKLARDIVAAQEKEIAMMKAWLAAHPE
ncbi:MAG: DUF305 domain-containing protein [Parvibaculum sp.]|nr:DUF305 domain-containing protein [Parvibaculum sp.]